MFIDFIGIYSPCPSQISEFLTKKDEHGVLVDDAKGDKFKRYFIIYMVTTLFKRTRATGSTYKILKCLGDLRNVRRMNWCAYVMNCLHSSIEKFRDFPGTFDGPLLLLLVNDLIMN